MPSKSFPSSSKPPDKAAEHATSGHQSEQAGGGSVPGRNWFDEYSLHAQWAPVLAVVAPAIFAVYMTFPQLVGLKEIAGGALLVAALPPLLAHTARNLGKRLESGLWASWDGKPTTRLLRHRDQVLAEPTKRRYFEALLLKAGIVRPTAAEESANPAATDRIYESAGDWLRPNTRDPRALSLVAPKNAAYGFARNLLGVRLIGGLSALLVGLAEAALTVQAVVLSSPKYPNFAAAAVVNLGVAALWCFAVRPSAVRLAADAYAIALLECLEPAGGHPARPARAPEAAPARKTLKKSPKSTPNAAPTGTAETKPGE